MAVTDGGWPPCHSMIEVLGIDLACILPLGHEMDGARFHENVEGVQWWTKASNLGENWVEVGLVQNMEF